MKIKLNIIKVIMISLFLFSYCNNENKEDVANTCLDYLNKTYNETFIIKELSFYDSVKKGTYTHKSSFWTIIASPRRSSDIEFKVVYNSLKRKSWNRVQTDFYINELWRYQIGTKIKGLFNNNGYINKIRFSNIHPVYLDIITKTKNRTLKVVPDFMNLHQTIPDKLQLNIELSLETGSGTRHLKNLVKLASWLNKAELDNFEIKINYFKKLPDMSKKVQNREKKFLKFGFQVNSEDKTPSITDLQLLLDIAESQRNFYYIFKSGLQFHMNDNYKMALIEYNKIINSYKPYSSYIRYIIESNWNAAQIHIKNKDYKEAIRCFNIILKQKKLPPSHYSATAGKRYYRGYDIVLMDGKTHYSHYLKVTDKRKKEILKLINKN